MTAAAATTHTDNRRRAYWLKILHEWHWVSSAMCLIGMILFSVTGFTLNHAGQIDAEWSDDEIYLSLPRPGGDAWLRVSLTDGEAEYERTDRGWLSYLNDLHKGRNTGAAWSWFIDIFAGAALVFSITGLLILKMHAGNRPFTWPMVGMGLVIPVLLALLFIH
jgi:hypothetical protein